MQVTRLIRIFAIATLVGFLTISSALSNRLYLDVGGGYGPTVGMQPLAGSGATDGMGIGFHFMFAHEWQRSTSMLGRSLGLQPRMEIAGGTSLIPLYGVGRMQVGRVYIGAGFAPLVMSTALAPISGAMGIMGEWGIDFRIIPTFSVVLGATIQSFIASGGTPLIAQGFLAFRFYSDPPNSRAGRYGYYEGYEGWRYPYGNDQSDY